MSHSQVRGQCAAINVKEKKTVQAPAGTSQDADYNPPRIRRCAAYGIQYAGTTSIKHPYFRLN